VAIKDDLTIAEISKRFEVHPTQINEWKSLATKNFLDIFSKGNIDKEAVNLNKKYKFHIEILERKIGQLTIDNDFLKKNWENYQQGKGLK
jgi:transposase